MTTVEKARITDAPRIQQLINHFAQRGEMLARSLSEIYENIRDYLVIREGERIIAVAALHIDWEDLAEIRSLAVDEGSQKKDLGSRLVLACIDQAREIGIDTVYCLTFKPAFFEKLGFSQRDKMELPRKIWVECYRCPKFPNCDEVALIYNLKTAGPASHG